MCIWLTCSGSGNVAEFCRKFFVQVTTHQRLQSRSLRGVSWCSAINLLNLRNFSFTIRDIMIERRWLKQFRDTVKFWKRCAILKKITFRLSTKLISNVVWFIRWRFYQRREKLLTFEWIIKIQNSVIRWKASVVYGDMCSGFCVRKIAQRRTAERSLKGLWRIIDFRSKISIEQHRVNWLNANMKHLERRERKFLNHFNTAQSLRNDLSLSAGSCLIIPIKLTTLPCNQSAPSATWTGWTRWSQLSRFHASKCGILGRWKRSRHTRSRCAATSQTPGKHRRSRQGSQRNKRPSCPKLRTPRNKQIACNHQNKPS